MNNFVRLGLLSLACSLSMALFSAPTVAKTTSSKDKNQSEISDVLADRELDKRIRFAINNTLFTIYHEVGHLLVDQLQWPVLGREEDVADNFATHFLLNQSRRSFEQALQDSALGWRLEDEYYGGNRTDSDFYDEHSLDLQRAFQIVCLMVGKDRRTFQATALAWRMDRRRQAVCQDDYQQIATSMELLMAPHADKTTETRVEVIFERANAQTDLAYKTLRESRLLESVAEELRRGYGLTQNVTLRADLCGEPNAFYDSSASEIIICYELLDSYFEMIDLYLQEQS